MGNRLIGKDKSGKITVDRELMTNFGQAEGWAKNYANCEYHKGESFTVYDHDGVTPIVTYHNRRK